MQSKTTIAPRGPTVMLVDSNAVFRAACRALLLTEGLEVVADLPPTDSVVAAAAALRPDIALVEVLPGEATGIEIARRLGELPGGPAVVLISSAEVHGLRAEIGAISFLAKADICAEALTANATVRGSASDAHA